MAGRPTVSTSRARRGIGRSLRVGAGLALVSLAGVAVAGTPAAAGPAPVPELVSPGEIPTDGRPVEAVEARDLGALGAAVLVLVVLACPAICLAMPFLERRAPASGPVTATPETAAVDPRRGPP